jgi:hypothetical protein
MSNRMLNVLIQKLDTCKNECKILTEKLNQFDLKNCEEQEESNDIIDEKRHALINSIKHEKEYENFYKEAIMNLIKNI